MDRRPRHGAGGIVIDKGGFNWASGAHPLYDTPDTSYGGLRWGHDLPEGLAWLAYKLRLLTVPSQPRRVHLARQLRIFLQGIETLSLRMERHCRSLKVAEHLVKHPKVAWVRYPGLKDDPQYAKNVGHQGQGRAHGRVRHQG